MDYDYMNGQIFFNACAEFGMDQETIAKAVVFRRTINSLSNATVGHITDGWFVVYDHPPAEEWARNHLARDKFDHVWDQPFTLMHFENRSDAMEMKLRWC